MSARPAAISERRSVILDLMTLAKPRITGMVMASMGVGYALAPRAAAPWASGRSALLAFAGTALVVAGANALNMYLERDSDARMLRTRNRPLPSGRMAPELALACGLMLSAVSVPLLTFGVNPMTGLLGAISLVAYVLVYTPLKRVSPIALLVGAVPGAIPPLMGWTAATGRLTLGALGLFGVMFLWQLPHFLAIALFRRDEYARAGLPVLPNVAGERVTKHHIVRYTVALVLATLLLAPLGVAGRRYLVAAAVLGAAFFAVGLQGLRIPVSGRVELPPDGRVPERVERSLDPGTDATNRWAKGLFVTSIVYLVLLFTALVADGAGPA